MVLSLRHLVLISVCICGASIAAAQDVEKIKVERQARAKSLALPVEIHWPKITAARTPAFITIGASGGYDATTAKRSWQDISAAVRATFKLE